MSDMLYHVRKRATYRGASFFAIIVFLILSRNMINDPTTTTTTKWHYVLAAKNQL
jgi:hypothetical protein